MMKRYYDTSAIIYFFSKSTSEHKLSPYNRSLDDSALISEIAFEESVHTYLVKKREKDLDKFISYLSKCFTSRGNNSLQLFKELLKKCHSEGVIRTGEKYTGDGKIDVRDIHHYASAIALGADEVITNDADFRVFDENQNLAPHYLKTKPGIVVLPSK